MTEGLGLLVIMKFTEWYKDASPDKPSIFDSRKDNPPNCWKHEPLLQRLARVMPRLKLGRVARGQCDRPGQALGSHEPGIESGLCGLVLA